MNLTCIFFGIIFFISGQVFATGKLLKYIVPWKMMSQEEKDKISVIPLCRNIGQLISISGFIFLISGIIPWYKEHLFTISMIIWLIVSGLDLWHIEKSKKYVISSSK